MHSRSHAFFAAPKRCWSLLIAYSKNAAPRHRSTAAVIRRNFKVEVKPRCLSFLDQPDDIAHVQGQSAFRFWPWGPLGIFEHPIYDFLKHTRRWSALKQKLVDWYRAPLLIPVQVFSLMFHMEGTIVPLDQGPARIPDFVGMLSEYPFPHGRHPRPGRGILSIPAGDQTVTVPERGQVMA